ncbi:hypothetical protein [Chengkuizengella marina]|uniref:hypothetical protein n=1 Tax=Chengkuizengella marina TaxID=2507566 RepID=UPI001369BE26|nr:hypothetical protein [Chengkuizengella marina]
MKKNRNVGIGSFKPLKKIVKPGEVLGTKTYYTESGQKVNVTAIKGNGKIKDSKSS